MTPKLHFISGLPRAGSTLLSAILRQNPRFHAAMTSPVGAFFSIMLNSTGIQNDFAVFLTEEKKKQLLKGLFDAYYADMQDKGVIFDTNRLWCARLPALVQLFPESKFVCCVRNVAWVLDSFERIVRRNAFDVSLLFGSPDERDTVYSRTTALAGNNRIVGVAWNALKEAYYS
jgi:sulfotransferase